MPTTLDAIAETQGSGSRTKKDRLITAFLSEATPLEAKYLVKIFTGEMRTGLHQGLMEQAVARAFGFASKGAAGRNGFRGHRLKLENSSKRKIERMKKLVLPF